MEFGDHRLSMAAASKSQTMLLVFLLFFGVVSCQQPPPPSSGETCPRSRDDVGLCVKVLRAVDASVGIGSPNTTESQPCCDVLQGLTSLGASTCLCAAIRLGALQLLHADLTIGVIVQTCTGQQPQDGFTCT